jgi:hypothetical protein
MTLYVIMRLHRSSPVARFLPDATGCAPDAMRHSDFYKTAVRLALLMGRMCHREDGYAADQGR